MPCSSSPWTGFFIPEPPPPSKPASGAAKIRFPFTALYASLVDSGVTPKEARSLSYGEAAWIVEARNDARQPATGGGARDATQSDIKMLMG